VAENINDIGSARAPILNRANECCERFMIPRPVAAG